MLKICGIKSQSMVELLVELRQFPFHSCEAFDFLWCDILSILDIIQQVRYPPVEVDDLDECWEWIGPTALRIRSDSWERQLEIFVS